MILKKQKCCFHFLLLALIVCCSFDLFADVTARERTTCKGEAFTFWLWSFLAGSANPDRVLALPDTELISFTASDGRILKGFRLRPEDLPVKGYVLVMQGNGWLASSIAPYLASLRNIGLDVYVYDFRGYGLSRPGLRRFAAMLDDYREIIAELNTIYQYRFLYGFSFGGVILLNAVQDFSAFDLIVIDSSPSTVEGFTCTENYTPVDQLPSDCSNFVLISGKKDRVVKQKRMAALLKQGQACGAVQDINKLRGHPFQNESDKIREQRVLELSALFREKMLSQDITQ